MIADCVVEQCTQLAAIATKGKKVVSNRGIRRTGLQPCNHEKADTRILPYTQDDVRSGFKKVMIAANDTDVVISLYALFDLGRDELWIEYGSDKQQRWLPIHTYASVLGEEVCLVLPFWYAFTSCDTASLFPGMGKKAAWETWNCFPESTLCFVSYCMFEALSLITIRHLEWYRVCCDPN